MAKAEKKAQPKQKELVQEAPAVYCLGKMTPIKQIKPNPENPNVHPQEQLNVLADVLRVNGWRQPIVVSNLSGMVVKGHGRLQTALHMKLEEVPVDHQDYADAQAEFQDMVADNRVAQLAYTDAFKLGSILRKMSEDGKKHLGYSQEEMALFSAAEYVAPEQTDRKFVVLETLKLTREAKAIIAGAVQKFCLKVGKEVDWGEALASIIKYIASTTLPSGPADVLRTDDDFLARCYTRKPEHKALAESIKASGKRALIVAEQAEGVQWVVELEEVA